MDVMQDDRSATPAASAGAGEGSRFGWNKLKVLLVAGDALAIVLGFSLVLFLGDYTTRMGPAHAGLLLLVAVTAGLWAVRSQGLLLARVSAVRVLELTRSARAMVILGALMLTFDRIATMHLRVREAAFSAVLSFVILVVFRSIYRSWVAIKRTRGRYSRAMVVIGTDDEAWRLVELFNTHRDLGINVLGVIGDQSAIRRRAMQELWLGDADSAEAIVAKAGVSGVVVSANAMPAVRLNSLVRNLQIENIHVHLATGISGMDARRLRALPMAHEPLLYVEAPSLSRLQVIAKWAFDTLVAGISLLVLSPVFLLIAIGIKLDDGGPVFFRQVRVGRQGKTFGVFKFRTMGVDAEKQLARLAATNERQGPLFKMVDDPRVTRIGRFLRESSLDELPQLLNVLRGEMSLVGPRPALPAEVAKFSAQLRARELVMPGITGLWQVEARDNPSFEAYRRLDLFYVENWSIALDLLIIVGTVEQVLVKLLRTLRRRSPAPAELPASTAVSAGN